MTAARIAKAKNLAITLCAAATLAGIAITTVTAATAAMATGIAMAAMAIRPAFARQNGLPDGTNDGRKDRATRHSFRPTQGDNYKNAPGYSSSMGDRQLYKDAYRQAYQQGYQQGYR